MSSHQVMSPVSDALPPGVGERNSAAKLTPAKVKAIRFAYANGASLSALATAFGVSDRAARHIVRRTSWTHI